MPEINFQINLPDGKKASLYSPSTVILEYLKPGDSLKISDFKSLAIQALHKALKDFKKLSDIGDL